MIVLIADLIWQVVKAMIGQRRVKKAPSGSLWNGAAEFYEGCCKGLRE